MMRRDIRHILAAVFFVLPLNSMAAQGPHPDLSGTWHEISPRPISTSFGAQTTPRTLRITQTHTALTIERLETSPDSRISYDLTGHTVAVASVVVLSTETLWQGDRLKTIITYGVVDGSRVSTYRSSQVLFVRPDGVLVEEFTRDVDERLSGSALGRPVVREFRRQP
jgi:hypothetical protein